MHAVFSRGPTAHDPLLCCLLLSVRLLCRAGYAQHRRDAAAALVVTAAALCDVLRARPPAVMVRDLAEHVTFPLIRDDAYAAALRLLVQRTVAAERLDEGRRTFWFKEATPLMSLRHTGAQALLDAMNAIRGATGPLTDIGAAYRVWRTRGVVCPIWAGDLAVDWRGPHF